MIIKNITIRNFRCYYGDNSFDIGDRLTLIIGDNGDGKSAFFDALEWLFDTVGRFPKADKRFISKKRCTELLISQNDYVLVSMSYVENNRTKIFEKSFQFSKTEKGAIISSNPSVKMFVQEGSEKLFFEDAAANSTFDRDFAASVRKYSLFKGEHDLNVFNKEEALSYLVETFSQVKDFDPYLDFMEVAKIDSTRATENAMKADRKNRDNADRLSNLIALEERTVGEKITERDQSLSEASKYKTLLEDIEQSKEASELLVNTNNRLKSLEEDRDKYYSQINENYTFRLLDDMWILLGYEPIAQEFTELVSKIDLQRRKAQSQHDQELGAKKLASKLKEELKTGFVPLAPNVPDEKTMREMLHEEVCKVCGRPAPKGSEAYNHMKRHLEDYLESLKGDVDEEEVNEPPLFKHAFIPELVSRYSILHNNMKFITNMNSFIEKEFDRNFKLHDKISKIDSAIEKEEETKKKILANTDGLSEEQLVSSYQNINNWWQLRNNAEHRVEALNIKINKHQTLLDEYRMELEAIAKDSPAATYSRISTAIRKIYEAFVLAKYMNRRDFLNSLEKVANEYLDVLNVDNFTGRIRIDERANNSAEVMLVDSDNAPILDPNTALKTTMYMSLLFAVAKLTTIKHENDYPLIFDAPTSSFSDAKESEFFNVVGGINKQTIIVTKSFLVEDTPGHSKLNMERVKEIQAKKYRIEIMKPYNKEDLSTIRTTITALN